MEFNIKAKEQTMEAIKTANRLVISKYSYLGYHCNIGKIKNNGVKAIRT
ncbi:hypothetical protein [Bartonella gliris]